MRDLMRNLWLLYAAPSASEGVAFLRNVAIPFAAAAGTIHLYWPDMPPFRYGPTLFDLVWLSLLLRALRQRDEARGRYEALQRSVRDALTRRQRGDR